MSYVVKWDIKKSCIKKQKMVLLIYNNIKLVLSLNFQLGFKFERKEDSCV